MGRRSLLNRRRLPARGRGPRVRLMCGEGGAGEQTLEGRRRGGRADGYGLAGRSASLKAYRYSSKIGRFAPVLSMGKCWVLLFSTEAVRALPIHRSCWSPAGEARKR